MGSQVDSEIESLVNDHFDLKSHRQGHYAGYGILRDFAQDLKARQAPKCFTRLTRRFRTYHQLLRRAVLWFLAHSTGDDKIDTIKLPGEMFFDDMVTAFFGGLGPALSPDAERVCYLVLVLSLV
jgi:hypothetical protein